MMWLFPDIFPKQVISFVTRAHCDFRVQGGNYFFNQRQKEVLEAGFGGRKYPSVQLRQQHTNEVYEISGQTPCVLDGDGLMTRETDTPLAVRTADCVPVFIYDAVKQGIVLLHAGWKSTHNKIVEVAVQKMTQTWGTQPQDIVVAIGPSIHSCCYEVGADFKDIFPEDIAMRNKKYYLDLPQANRRQLIALGVAEDQIWNQAPCTCCDDQFFSHRREGENAGRMLCGMMLVR